MGDKSEETRLNRRRFLTAATTAVGAVGVALTAYPFISSMDPNAEVRAQSTTRVDISKVKPGMALTVLFRGHPVAVVKRTPAMLATLTNPALLRHLRDPNNDKPQQPENCKNPYRSINPQWLVMIQVCTHLGCVPLFSPKPGSVTVTGLLPQWWGGYHCPCHGSLYDLSGRVFQNVPAPMNMAIPVYHFEDGGKSVLITSVEPDTFV